MDSALSALLERLRSASLAGKIAALFLRYRKPLIGGDLASTAVMKSKVHVERVVTLVNQSLQLL